MAIRNIRTVGDEILRKKSKPVEVIDEKILQLLDDMYETLKSSDDGVGIAAPQVGVLRRVIVVDLSDEEGGEGPFKLVNPVIIKAKGEQVCREGCLSVPNTLGDVSRPKKLVVEALNEKGEKVVIKAEDLLAIVLSHEIDHLDGVLFIDKASNVEQDVEGEE